MPPIQNMAFGAPAKKWAPFSATTTKRIHVLLLRELNIASRNTLKRYRSADSFWETASAKNVKFGIYHMMHYVVFLEN